MFIDAAADNCQIAVDTWDRPDAETLEAFTRYPAANVGDALDRFGLMRASIKAWAQGSHCVGPALPVLTREGDNLAVHRALDESAPGDVLVINGFGDESRAVFGDLLAEVCLARGVVGVVIHGAVRDVDAIARLGLPVWASSVTPAGPTKDGPGIIGAAVACGGVIVCAGDIIVADMDGVAVVPNARSADVLARLREIERTEDAFRLRVKRSLSADHAAPGSS